MQGLHLMGSGPSGAYANTFLYKNNSGKKFVVKEPIWKEIMNEKLPMIKLEKLLF